MGEGMGRLPFNFKPIHAAFLALLFATTGSRLNNSLIPSGPRSIIIK